MLALIGRAKKELLIDHRKIDDTGRVPALNERAKNGVDVRVIGSLGKKGEHLQVRPLSGFRLHTRTIVCDRREAFVGSQSLRKAELDARREVGLIVRDKKVVSGLLDTFEADWGAKASDAAGQSTPREIKKALKATVVKLSPLDPLVKEAVDDVVQQDGPGLTVTEVKKTVEKAVKEAVRERVQEMLNEAVED